MAWSFGGRSAELRRIQTVLRRGASQGVLIVGALGSGKTQLAREVVHGLERTGHPTAWVAATSSAQRIPFGAMATLIEDPPAAAPTVEFLQSVLRTMTDRIGDGERLVLGVDDANLLDDPSAAVIHRLCISGACFAVVTAPVGEHLPHALDALWRGGSLELMELRPLEPKDIAAVASQALGGPVDPFTLAELARLSEGNPLLLRELVLGGIDSGALHREDATWVHEAPLAQSPGVVRAIKSRHAGLNEQQHELLELIALGEPLAVDLLHAESALLEALEERALVAVDAEQVRLAHPLHGEVLRSQLRDLRARRLYERLARLMEDQAPGDPEDLLRLAHWQLAAGRPPDAGTLTAAARRALAALNLELAERLATAAGDHTDGLRTLAQVHMASGRWAQVHATLERAAVTGSPAEQAETMKTQAVAVARGGHPQMGLALLGASDPDGNLARALILVESGEPRQASELLEEASPTTTEAQLELHTVASLLHAWLGRPHTAMRHVEAGLELAPACRTSQPLAQANLEMHRVLALMLAGQLREAERRARTAYERSILAGVEELAGSWGVWLGKTLLLRGRPVQAATVLAEAGGRLRRTDPFGMKPGCLALRAMSSAARGEVSEADAHLATLDTVTEHRRHRFVSWSGRARAWIAAQQGDVATALGHVLNAAAAEAASPPTAWGALALHDAVRLGQPAAPELREALVGAEGDLLPLLVAHAEALRDDDAAGLAAVATAFEDVGADLFAAEAGMQAAGAHRRAGRTHEARALSSRTRRIAGRCEGAATPALKRPPGRLTARELEIATLAAQGMTDRHIAAHLGIALRTVENHLHRTYTKLQISGRDELPPELA